MKEEFKVPANEIEKRLSRIQKELREYGIDGILIVQRVDLFYFSGTSQNGFLYIPSEGEPLLCIKKYLPRALKESSIKNIVGIKSVKDLSGMINDFYSNRPHVLGFEFDVLPVREFNFYRTLFPDQEHVDGSPLIHKVRMIKSNWEVTQMEKAAELAGQTFGYMRDNIRTGLSEMEFAGMFETFARRLGHGGKIRVRDYQTEAYPWHVLSGKNGGMLGLLDSPASGEGTSAAFPCGGGSKLFSENEPIMIDFSFVLNGYHTDETRMFAIGSMPEKALTASHAAIEISHAVLDKVRPGITIDELFQTSVSKAELVGYADQYLGPTGHKVTFIGHGIGLELVEPPVIAKGRNESLEPGMTFALEPKMVFENEFSAGIENMVLVTEKGYRLISKVPVDVFIC